MRRARSKITQKSEEIPELTKVADLVVRFVDIIESGEKATLRRVVGQGGPASTALEHEALKAIDSGDSFLQLMGLCCFAQKWADFGEFGTGEITPATISLCHALSIVARRRFAGSHKRDFLTPARWAAEIAVKCHSKLGESDLAAKVAEEAVTWLEEQGNYKKF